MAYPKRESYGSRNLAEFAAHVRKAVDEATADPVHLRGSKTAVSQLPQSADDGDIWFVTATERFYVRLNGLWKSIGILREAGVVESLPSDSEELAALIATLEEGAHLTVMQH